MPCGVSACICDFVNLFLLRIRAKWLIEIRIEAIDAIDRENRLWGEFT